MIKLIPKTLRLIEVAAKLFDEIGISKTPEARRFFQSILLAENIEQAGDKVANELKILNKNVEFLTNSVINLHMTIRNKL